MSEFDFEAYRTRIGIGDVGADAEGLHTLQKAHLSSIPFENFDPLLDKVPSVDLAGICAKIVDQRRGGYCFEHNTLFGAALGAAGFTFRRALARVRMRFGTEAARSHLVLLVELDGRTFLADAGFGGPGSLAPLELGAGAEQHAPNGTYRLIDDTERGEMVLERFDGDGWLSLYAFDHSRVTDGEIAAANYFCATWQDAPFGSHLLINCYSGTTRYGLFDRSLTTETAEGTKTGELSSFDEFAEFIECQAGIDIGREALRKAWEKIA